MRSNRLSLKQWFNSDRARAIIAATIALAAFLTTVQWSINGSRSPYATDVGEIQNALPRWGTIHFTGYPLYTFTGSVFVTLLRGVGIEPAAGASCLSAVWGATAVGLLARLALELGVPGAIAVISSLIAALSTSAWIDASIAEVHTLTLAFALAILVLALRFGRSGARRDLMGLVLAFTQGIAHQRALAFLAPAVMVLILPRMRVVRRNLLSVIGVAMLAPLTLLYLPLRYWQGAEWTFGQPGTWRGFWAMVLDTKASRIVHLPTNVLEGFDRVKIVLRLLGEDLPAPLVALGLAGLLTPMLGQNRREGLALGLAALPYLVLCLVIWEGRVSDALLAVKLPVIHLAGLGLGLAAGEISRRWPGLQTGFPAGLAVLCVATFLSRRPKVLAITRDLTAESVIATVDQVAATAVPPTTFMALWGHDYWALAYAQAYRGELRGLGLVDHNADFRAILERGDRLLTLEKTFHLLPPSWWEDRVGPVSLSSICPGVVEIARAPTLAASDVPSGPHARLGNGIILQSALLDWSSSNDQLALTIYWLAERVLDQDYSVAVHLVAHDSPGGPNDILAQFDSRHPVYGWYPTSRWQAGEIVRDDYMVRVPAGSQPAAVRVCMYLVGSQGQSVNTKWLCLPMPARATEESPQGDRDAALIRVAQE